MPDEPIPLRLIAQSDQAWVARVTETVGGPVIASGGLLHDLRDRPGLIAERNRGLIQWHDTARTREILALVATPKGAGTGRALLAAALRDAQGRGLAEASLDTTDDNSRAIRFYQRNGFTHVETIRDGFADILRLKGLPPDPVIGQTGTPIRDILRFTIPL